MIKCALVSSFDDAKFIEKLTLQLLPATGDVLLVGSLPNVKHYRVLKIGHLGSSYETEPPPPDSSFVLLVVERASSASLANRSGALRSVPAERVEGGSRGS